jgi:hypothetical protein
MIEKLYLIAEQRSHASLSRVTQRRQGISKQKEDFNIIIKMIKVRLTRNMIFGLCNIWVIRRRNVIYLYNKKSHLDQLFRYQSFRI